MVFHKILFLKPFIGLYQLLLRSADCLTAVKIQLKLLEKYLLNPEMFFCGIQNVTFAQPPTKC